MEPFTSYNMFEQPEIGHRRINIFGSLTKATHFDAQYLLIDFQFEFPSTNIKYNQKDTELKYKTNCSYYMKTNNTKTHNFGNIFELQITENISKRNYESYDKSPKIYFEVNSMDNWNRHRIEGYGIFNINLDENNNNNNNNDICIPIWRPIGSIRDEMTRFFIGGGKRLKDKKLIYVPQIDNKFNSRINWNTVHSGYLHLNINILSINNQTKTSLSQLKILNDDNNNNNKNNKRKKRRSKLSKLVTIEQDESQKNNDRHQKKRKRKSSLLQKLELSD